MAPGRCHRAVQGEDMVVRFLLMMAVGASLAGMLLHPPAAKAVPCEHRSEAHVADHGGLAADSAWHVANGQLPTCGDGGGSTQRAEEPRDSDEGKSRYCRKRWFC
jgi:hypothetical protein